MSVLIIVFKKELKKYEGLGHRLSKLSRQVNELDEACVYVPEPGNLLEVINSLRRYQAEYTMISDAEDMLKKEDR